MRWIAVVALGACAGGGLTNQGPSEDRLYLVDVRFNPDPPIAGDVVMTVTLTDPDDAPVTGATLTAAPFHPSMGHGISDDPVVTEGDGGEYAVAFAFSMPGEWDIPITISAAPGEDSFQAWADVQ